MLILHLHVTGYLQQVSEVDSHVWFQNYGQYQLRETNSNIFGYFYHDFNNVEVCEFYEFSLQRCSFLIYMYVRVSQPLWCVFKGLETILVSLYRLISQEYMMVGSHGRWSQGHIFMNIWFFSTSQYLNNIYMSRAIYSKSQKWIPMSGSRIMANTSSGKQTQIFLAISIMISTMQKFVSFMNFLCSDVPF